MEEIEIIFNPEINEDISKDKVHKTTIDFIINYEDRILNISEMEKMKNLFIDEEFFYYAGSITRAIKAIKIIFE